MKKKLLLISILVLVVVISAVTFSACSQKISLTKKMTQINIFNEESSKLPETMSYKMFDKNNNQIGTYTTTVKEFSSFPKTYLGLDGETTEANAVYTLSASSNTTVVYSYETNLTLLDGSYAKKTISYFDNSLLTIGSYSKVVENGKTTTVIAKNVNDDRYYFKKYVDGTLSVDESIKNGKYESSPYYDNTMTYMIARNMPKDDSYASFSYSTFDIDTLSKTTVTVTNSSTVNPATSELSYPSREITLSTSDKILGKTNNLKCYISDEKVNGYNGVILKIVEGNYSYVLEK